MRTVSDGSRRLCKLLVGESGSAAPEYALVVCAVITVIIGAGFSFAPSFENVSARLANQPLNVSRSGQSSASQGPADAQGDFASAPRQRSVGRNVAVAAVFGTLIIAVVGCGVWAVRDRRRERPAEKKDAPKKPAVEKIVQTRLSRKRDLLWRQLMENYDLFIKNRIEVRHVMTRELVVIKDNTPGAELARLFRSNDVSCLLVCDESRRLTGIVDADDHQLKPEAPTAQVKQPAPREIAPNAFLGAALERFIAERVTMLPVVENNQLCGVLTPTDVVLTMQCSLQLWARATNAVRENAQASERLEDITKSMQQDIRQQETLTKRIHGDVQTAVRTGQLEPLVQGVNELMTTVGRLSNQLRQAREEIRRQREEAADLKEPESDELTGVGSRRELDLVLRRLLAKCAPPEQPLTAVLVAADAYNKLRELQKPQEADEYLRILAQWLASKVESSGFVARYAPDRFVLALPQMRPEDACQWSRRLSEYDGRGTAGGEFLRPRIGIVSARRGEEAPELLARLEAVLQSA